MMDDPVGHLVGCEAITRQLIIVAPHGTVVAILSAVIRHLDHAAHEHLPAKDSIPRRRRPRMKRFLRLNGAIYPQKVLPQTTHGLYQR
jgi:hypothetical protein